MRSKKLMFVVILALVASYLSYTINQKKKRLALDKLKAAKTKTIEKKEPKTGKVVCFSKNLKNGYMLIKTDMIVKDVKISDIPKNSFKDINKLIGRFVIKQASEGSIITEDILYEKGLRPSLALYVPNGKRAVNIKIRKEQCVGGFLRQNDHIDILGIFSSKVSDKPFVKLLASNAEVLTISSEFLIPGRPIDIDPKNKKNKTKDLQKGKVVSEKIVVSATIIVTPEEAERIVLTTEIAKLYFMLRSPFEENEEYILPFNKYDLVNMKREEQINVKKQIVELEKNKVAVLKERKNNKRNIIEVYKGANLELISPSSSSSNGGNK